ncbi:hypothetical protein C7M84_010652 [Penaeus vannamei]|uniref:Uncharacterized protein n=1 Tax=Penaeus vannamei TaxID=6689 RepID=A0A3R7QL98_PENVA|nr:hypothetical protein C7M84_010652 [Penaeus vannamei]
MRKKRWKSRWRKEKRRKWKQSRTRRRGEVKAIQFQTIIEEAGEIALQNFFSQLSSRSGVGNTCGGSCEVVQVVGIESRFHKCTVGDYRICSHFLLRDDDDAGSEAADAAAGCHGNGDAYLAGRRRDAVIHPRPRDTTKAPE